MENNFIEDDAALWYKERATQIQDFKTPEPFENITAEEAPAADGTDTAEQNDPNITARDVHNHKNAIKLNSHAAAVIVGVQDSIIPILACLIVKTLDKNDLKLTEDEQETLTEAWAEYLAEKEVNLTPGWALVVTLTLIYSAKFTEAVQNAKERSKLKAAQEEIEQLKIQLQETQQENKRNYKEWNKTNKDLQRQILKYRTEQASSKEQETATEEKHI